MNEVAEGQFDLAEGLLFGEVNELLGHVTERLFSMGPQFVDKGLDTSFAVIGDRLRSRRRGV